MMNSLLMTRTIKTGNKHIDSFESYTANGLKISRSIDEA
jgi:hypothetical protein